MWTVKLWSAAFTPEKPTTGSNLDSIWDTTFEREVLQLVSVETCSYMYWISITMSIIIIVSLPVKQINKVIWLNIYSPT